MINSYQSSIQIDSSAVHIIPNPLDTAFAIMYQSNSYIDSIYIADQYARTEAGSTAIQSYIDSLWVKTKNFTTLQFRRAAVEYGIYLYTAWVNAGKPSTFVELWTNQARDYHLDQNFPNPFNPTTTISFTVGKYRETSIKVFNMLGQEVASLVNEGKGPGTYSVSWNADKFPSGVYIYRLTAGENSFDRIMILLK